MDEHTHGSDDAGVHRVDEREVRLAIDRLDLADRTLNVYRATAFLTALGVTVSTTSARTVLDGATTCRRRGRSRDGRR